MSVLRTFGSTFELGFDKSNMEAFDVSHRRIEILPASHPNRAVYSLDPEVARWCTDNLKNFLLVLESDGRHLLYAHSDDMMLAILKLK